MIRRTGNYMLVMALILTACTSSPAAPSARAESAASSGPAGLSRVEVSDGVVLLTPGQTAGAESPSTSSENIISLVTATPTATVDPVSVEMPDGIPLYPEAMDLQNITEDPTGLGTRSVLFYTTDDMEKVIQFYTEKAASAGWTLESSETEPDYEGKLTQIWDKDNIMLMLMTWQPADGRMMVQLLWK